MAEVITMPRMSDTMVEGNIVAWHKKEGDSVEVGELLAEIETDKATMDFDSPADGVLLHIAIKNGAVPIDAVIAVIGNAGEDWKVAMESKGGNSTATVASVEATAPMVTVANSTTDAEARVKASPLAKSIAKEAGIDLTNIKGSGDHGRIVKKDLEAVISTPAPAPVVVQAPAVVVAPVAPKPAPEKIAEPSVVPFTFTGTGNNYEDVAVSQMRKTIARRLGESKFSAPHFYLTIEIDMDKATKLRKQLNEVAPVKLSFNDLVIKAVSVSLKQHPAINSSWMGDYIRANKDINIGVAVAVEDGLLVPVIRYADIKTLSQINTEVKELAAKAKNKKLQPQEMTGNTFTISNLGMFGIDEFTAIINPPDACILAIGSIAEKPVVKNGNIVIGQCMKVTLSCDHRVVDGAKGAAFLQTFKQILEDPIRLLV